MRNLNTAVAITLKSTKLAPCRVSIVAGTMIGLVAHSTAYALDLVEVYQQAIESDAAFASAEQSFAAARLDLPLAKSAFGPNLSATGGFGLSDHNLKQEGAVGNSFSNKQTQLGLSASKKIIDPSANLDIEAARVAEETAFINYSIAEQNLIQQTISRYLSVLSAQDNEALAKQENNAIAKQLDLSTQRLEVGLGTKTDQYDAIARFELSTSTLISARNAVIDAAQNLQELLGGAAGPAINAADLAALSESKIAYHIEDSADWLAVSTTTNKAYQLAQMQLAHAQIGLEKTLKLKSFSLDATGSWGWNDSSTSATGLGDTSDTWRVGLNASYPIYQAGSIKIQQKKAAHQLNAAQLSLEQTRRQIGGQIRTAQRSVQSINLQVDALEQAVIASENALVSKQEGFRVGVTTNLDVLDSQRDLFRARRDYLSARYDAINAIVGLELAAGALTADDVQVINSWLEN